MYLATLVIRATCTMDPGLPDLQGGGSGGRRIEEGTRKEWEDREGDGGPALWSTLGPVRRIAATGCEFM